MHRCCKISAASAAYLIPINFLNDKDMQRQKGCADSPAISSKVFCIMQNYSKNIFSDKTEQKISSNGLNMSPVIIYIFKEKSSISSSLPFNTTGPRLSTCQDFKLACSIKSFDTIYFSFNSLQALLMHAVVFMVSPLIARSFFIIPISPTVTSPT